ncbi:hypothetical protein A3770_03p24060 [Chloropicon primus]|uniref:Uncharacterized protein n=1 Tax=Chloropicon primus TaxID=1764295 RepID=A0A5B8MGS6_9CHLO|nr:hypothetical protein A3770_03p24060 [Chloropicon primus]|eukprot:QDZ19888.1 hypothetical protein A3770_03p24060 [Chloropicon primus]
MGSRALVASLFLGLLVATPSDAALSSVLPAVLNFAMPGNLADIDGDGTNLFGLSGISGTLTSTLFNTGAVGAVGSVRRYFNEPRTPRGPRGHYDHPESFTNKIRKEVEDRRFNELLLKKASGVLAVLLEKQKMCEEDFGSVCPPTTFPTVDSSVMESRDLREFDGFDVSELECRCVPAVSLTMRLDDVPFAEYNETDFRAALSGQLGVNPMRVPVTDSSLDGGRILLTVKVLPDLKEYYKAVEGEDLVVSAFDEEEQGDAPEIFQAPFLAALESFLSSESLEGFGRVDVVSVESPDEVDCGSGEYPLLCQ